MKSEIEGGRAPELALLLIEIQQFTTDAAAGLVSGDSDRYDNAMSDIATAVGRSKYIRKGY